MVKPFLIPSPLDPRINDVDDEGMEGTGRFYAALKPGFRLKGYGTHAFTFGSRKEYDEKLKLIEEERHGKD